MAVISLKMIRVRQITDKLSYDKLCSDGIIPDLMSLINVNLQVIATKRYPPFVYKTKNFSFFGMLMDYIIRAGLRINLNKKMELGQDPTSELITTLPEAEMISKTILLNVYETSNNINDIVRASFELTTLLYGYTDYNYEDIQSYIPTIVNIIKALTKKWLYFNTYLDGFVKYNYELIHRNLSGHPDIVTDFGLHQCVLDIKTTGSFPKMAKETCLQVLSYYALMKQTIPTIQYVGFVLPMQRDVAIYNMGNWDPSGFLQLLSNEADKLVTPVTPATLPQGAIIIDVDDDGNMDFEGLTRQLTGMHLHDIPFDEREQLTQALMAALAEEVTKIPRVRIGGHIAKGKNIATTLREFATAFPNTPCQMFLTNPRTGKKDTKTAGQIASAAQVIKETGLQFFTHAPYVINLCSNQCDNTGRYWQQEILNQDIAHTVSMGGKGVVVHTGARKHLSEPDALYIMEYMVRTALPYATESCPLLLETPCNEGTEVCGQIQDLGQFFYRFTEEERKKLGVCVDSCHVYSAGYDPLAYLQHWEKYCGVPIKLLHFNDSQGPAGCCKDRHAAPGHGHIGMEKMQAIAAWCHERNIPMVRE